MAIQNQVTYFIDPPLRTIRMAEVPDADWDGGGNYSASNANYIGINTGNFGPKDEDFGDVEKFAIGQTIGGVTTTVRCIDATFGDDARAGYVLTTGVVAPDGILGDINATNFFNRTGADVPSGEFVWGVAD